MLGRHFLAIALDVLPRPVPAFASLVLVAFGLSRTFHTICCCDPVEARLCCRRVLYCTLSGSINFE